jgi:capsular polysaccharide biosynthesis protein
VLPDTFRHHTRTLEHQRLREVAPGHVRPPFRVAGAARLPGTYYHLDNEHRGFFGHLLTEQVSRLWGWQEAKARHPDARLLVSLNRGRPVADWEWTILEAAGIPRSEVTVIEKRVRVERLLAATPMFSMPRYVHPQVVETWDRLGSALRAQASSGPSPRRIFVSRRHRKRACTNREEVEGLFRRHGFEVVFPEEMPVPDQVKLFHDADVVAGFAGSATFTVLFSDRPKHLVLISSVNYRAANEYMIAAVRGHRLDVATCQATVARGDGVDRKVAFRSSFTVDMEREGAWLEGVLAEID